MTISFRGTDFPSLRSVARAYGVDSGTFQARLKRGISMDQAVAAELPSRHGVTLRGVRYRSRNEACIGNGVTYNTVKDRQKRLGLSFEDAVFWERPEAQVGPKCAANGVARWTYWARIRRGWTEAQALGIEDPPKEDPAPRRAPMLKIQYGLTIEQFEGLVAKHGGMCWICQQEPNPPCVDHCHATGRVRGILCRACNTAIGRMGDDPARLRAAAAYLEST